MGSNPARVACEVFSTDTRKALSIQCCTHVGVRAKLNQLLNNGFTMLQLSVLDIYYWNKVTVHHLKLCYFLMKKDNTMICGVLLNHCLTVNRIISKSVCLDTRLRDTSLKRCGVKSRRMRRRCQACINANDGHTRY